MEGYVATACVIAFCISGLLFAVWRAYGMTKIHLADPRGGKNAEIVSDHLDNGESKERESEMSTKPINNGGAVASFDAVASSILSAPKEVATEEDPENLSEAVFVKMRKIVNAISRGANAFLYREYKFMAIFVVFFCVVILLLIGFITNWHQAGFTCIAFVVGAVTSIISGFLGMRIAVYSNGRTATQAILGWNPPFVAAFNAGCVMGFGLTCIAVLVLYILMNFYRLYWPDVNNDAVQTAEMFEALTGYGLGGSTIALFGRVGGGIYTKAADVGADLSGKLEQGIPEDDPRNPASVADNVGDNVGDIAGMGADLFGSYAESTCAALVVAAQAGVGDRSLGQNWAFMCFPLIVTSCGIGVSMFTTLFVTHFMTIKGQADIEPACKRQLTVSTIIMTPVMIGLSLGILPETFDVSSVKDVHHYYIFLCLAAGLWSGLIIGFVTEFYTSNAYGPVKEVANACKTGAATNIIYGMALGFKSVIIPVWCLACTIYMSFRLAGMYGISMAAIGILSTMATALTIDAYGPICDNAGGIAEMSGMGHEIRKKTDALDAAGNTTAAIGKGFAIGSAAFVSIALFGAYCTVVGLDNVNILRPFVFAGLLVGAMMPYWFSALTMKSVGLAANEMVNEVRRQFQDPDLMAFRKEPDYERCVAISTEAALKEMMAPGALVIVTPLLTGYLLGTEALAGLLVGIIVSGIQMAISASNTGGAWDNAKKYIETGNLGGKGSDPHKAAVVGDTVGDPLKDTSGPSLNILIKLSAIISVVFASSFPHTGYLVQLFKG